MPAQGPPARPDRRPPLSPAVVVSISASQMSQEDAVTQLIDRPASQSGHPFPSSRKVYVEGSRSDLRVPMREITLTPTSGRFGEEENAPVRVYDTSGPYTDPELDTDVTRGLPALRQAW